MTPNTLAQRPSRRRQGPAPRGAATLVVVMVLFFIIALVAAYTSRNLIFEQRTSANQYRSTQAFEAAESGIEWVLSMLNSGRIDAACAPRADPATPDESFRQRYLTIAPDTGRVTARLRAGGGPRQAACVFDGGRWQCSCPDDAAPALAAPVGAGPFPAFVLRFFDVTADAVPLPYPPGVVRVEATGCTRLDAAAVCTPAAGSGDSRATVSILAALKSALASPPSAPVTLRVDLTRAAGATATLAAVNDSRGAAGLTVHTGGAIQAGHEAWLSPSSAPGTPGDQSLVENDAALQALDAARMFSSMFGMSRQTYRLQPATVRVDCALDCSAGTVRDLARLNPGRVLWIDGDLDLSVADEIGSAALPTVLVVNGAVTVSTAGARVHGLVYATGATLTHAGDMTIEGAFVGEAGLALAGAGASRIVYDAAVLNLLNRSSGSFVRVPGSWRDF